MEDNLINIMAVKTANRSKILKLLYSRGRMSRKELAHATGLTPAAVSQQINKLIEEGIVYEAYQEAASRRAGRREIILDIPRERFVALGMLVSAPVSRIGLMDFSGRVLYERKLQYGAFPSVKDFEDTVAGEVESFTRDHVESYHRLTGFGIALKGIVSGEDGLWLDSYGMLPEPRVDVRACLERRLSIPVSLDDNVRAMVNAEVLLSGYTGHDGMLFIKLGPGLGAAICIGNKPYCGYKYKSAELGHTLVGGGHPLKGTCLEEIVSESAVIGRAVRIYGPQSTPVLNTLTRGETQNVSIAAMLAAYTQNDPGVEAIFEEVIQNLVAGIYNAVCLFDPRKIVLYGEAFGNEKFYGRLLRAAQGSGLMDGMSEMIELSAFNTKLDVRGAASLAVSRFLECIE